MKRSEMEKLLLNGLCDLGQWYDKPPEQVAQALCILLRPKDGWDPEEEPLPEKLVLYAGAMAEDLGQRATSSGRYRVVAVTRAEPGTAKRNAKILKAALEAYNEIGVLRKKLDNVQRCADRSDQLVDRWKGAVERAIARLEGPFVPGELISDLLAILKEEKA